MTDLRQAAWLEARGYEPCIWCGTWTRDSFHEDSCREAPAQCHAFNCAAIRPRATLVEGLCEACLVLADCNSYAEEAAAIAAQSEPTPGQLERVKELARLAWEGRTALLAYGRPDLAREAEALLELVTRYMVKASGWVVAA